MGRLALTKGEGEGWIVSLVIEFEEAVHTSGGGRSGFSALSYRLDVDMRGPLAEFEKLLTARGCEEMHGACDHPGPAGLMAGAQAGSVITVEVLVELNVIAPVRVFLELLLAAVHGPMALFVLQKNSAEPARDFFRDFIEIHYAA